MISRSLLFLMSELLGLVCCSVVSAASASGAHHCTRRRSLLQPCVETAQFAFGKKEVIAARDFMAIPVPAKPKQAFPEPDA